MKCSTCDINKAIEEDTCKDCPAHEVSIPSMKEGTKNTKKQKRALKGHHNPLAKNRTEREDEE